MRMNDESAVQSKKHKLQLLEICGTLIVEVSQQRFCTGGWLTLDIQFTRLQAARGRDFIGGS